MHGASQLEIHQTESRLPTRADTRHERHVAEAMIGAALPLARSQIASNLWKAGGPPHEEPLQPEPWSRTEATSVAEDEAQTTV